MEIFKDIPGYEGFYQASNYGNIKSVPRFNSRNGKILKHRPDKKGYGKVALYKNRGVKNYRVHILVLLTFTGERPDDSYQCRHLDGNNKNNHVDNLMWGTAKENGLDKKLHGTGFRPHRPGEKNPVSKLKDIEVLEIRRLSELGILNKIIAAKYNVSAVAISLIRHRRRWNHI